MIAALLLAALAQAAAGRAPAPDARPEQGCAAIVEANGRSLPLQPIPLRVLGGPDRLAIALPRGQRLRGLTCRRLSIAPQTGDDRVLRQLRVPFNLSAGDRVAVLEHNGRGFSYRQIRGAPLSPAERAGVARQLSAYNRVPLR